jgi:hypothetical protein
VQQAGQAVDDTVAGVGQAVADLLGSGRASGP